jgi:hypothetical protein
MTNSMPATTGVEDSAIGSLGVDGELTGGTCSPIVELVKTASRIQDTHSRRLESAATRAPTAQPRTRLVRRFSPANPENTELQVMWTQADDVRIRPRYVLYPGDGLVLA